jgi:hypothetical protein
VRKGVDVVCSHLGNSIGNEGSSIIAEALLQLPQLTQSLDISGILEISSSFPFGSHSVDTGIGGEGATRVFELCSLNVNLTYINLSRMLIDISVHILMVCLLISERMYWLRKNQAFVWNFSRACRR